MTDRSCELKSNQNVSCVGWISRNRLVCGYDKGTAEIHETELNDKTTSKLVKKTLGDCKYFAQIRTIQFVGRRCRIQCIECCLERRIAIFGI